jgi:hypothetical protein
MHCKCSGHGNTDSELFHQTISSVFNDHVSKARDRITDHWLTCTLPVNSKSQVHAWASETAEPNQWRAYGNGILGVILINPHSCFHAKLLQ